ncbi:hypothetical protein P0D87_15895 [Paraburkholderia sp. RL17-368-BIF-A]|uniref:hypothetical protein n=1 Tax=Paraburkholderia sp. RL17-368-BIF-A TaxID=3031628 RepID=UPI0038C30778
MAPEPLENRSPLEWEQFKELIELHKFYFENISKSAAFVFGLVGAIVSYVIATDIRDRYRLAAAMTVPILLSVGASAIGLLGAVKLRDLSEKVTNLQSELGLSWRPHSEVLPLLSAIFAVLFFLVACGLTVIVLHANLLPHSPAARGG